MRKLLLTLALMAAPSVVVAQVTVFPATGTADPAQFSSPDGSIVFGGIVGAVTAASDDSDRGHFSFGTGTVPANGIQGDTYFETDLVLPSWYVATNTPVTAVVLPGASGAPTDDSVPVGTGTAWAKEAIPDCDDSAGQHLNRDTGTNAWSCGTTSSASGGDTLVVKAAIETITSDDTLTADNTLVVAISASTKYLFLFDIFYASDSAADFKWQVTCPASPTASSGNSLTFTATGASTQGTFLGCATGAAAMTHTSGTGGGLRLVLYISNGTNAGSVSFLWAQNTSNGGNTSVLEGSNVKYRVIP